MTQSRIRLVYKIILLLLLFTLLPFTVRTAERERETMKPNVHTNHLANATSPYLLAHAHNPVDWYQWGDEAFAKAKAEDKPIFLSIGYNACHWCHVMERESFENEEIADLLNKNFVSIKVDREERPDIDQIYMSAVQAMTGSGGWPMSIFMTPDKKPFFAGTYFPPESKYGRPGFKEILTQLAEGYRTQHEQIVTSADSIVEHIAQSARVDIPGRAVDKNVIKAAADIIFSHYDNRNGGFGGAPKFPQATTLSLMFRASRATGDDRYAHAALFTLRKMAEGGMYDQLGGGFHRYSVDEKWLVPHFEKMLYDNALLVVPYLEAYQISGDEYYLDPANGTLKYLQQRMTDPQGGFYSTEDADTDGEEGKFYTWTKAEIDGILGPESDRFCEYYGVTDGNFENGRNILNVGDHSEDVRKRINLYGVDFDAKLAELKTRLLAERAQRTAPAIDDKILASWNGLAISAFARAYQVTSNDSYLKSAKSAADFVLKRMTDGEKLYHSYRQGKLLKTELLEDYAYFAAGLIDLYQAGFDEKYLEKAKSLSRRAMEIFSDDGKLYSSPADASDLIYRPRDLTDGATPAPASVMIMNLHRLASITDNQYFTDAASKALAAVSGLAARVPQGSASLLEAGYFAMQPPVEIVMVGDRDDKMAEFNREIFSRYIPNKIIVGHTKGGKSTLPLLEGRQDVAETTYYFCYNRTCRLPVTDKSKLIEELEWAADQAAM
jgi:uncharacterized protein YyaL (SSP411 family)